MSASTTTGTRVLIVEDDLAVRTVIDRFLTDAGFDTLTAVTAEDADALLRQSGREPQLAVVDIVLPGGCGLAFADELRRRYLGIRFVFMTGWDDPERGRQAEARGVLLRKPFGQHDLIAAIRPPATGL
jgi:DNA-binding response OmpR family regulator